MLLLRQELPDSPALGFLLHRLEKLAKVFDVLAPDEAFHVLLRLHVANPTVTPNLRWIKADSRLPCSRCGMWHQVHSLADIPADRDVRLAVIDGSGTVHALVFPCRRAGNSWIDSRLRRPVEVHPTHWQDWAEASK